MRDFGNERNDGKSGIHQPLINAVGVKAAGDEHRVAFRRELFHQVFGHAAGRALPLQRKIFFKQTKDWSRSVSSCIRPIRTLVIEKIQKAFPIKYRCLDCATKDFSSGV